MAYYRRWGVSGRWKSEVTRSPTEVLKRRGSSRMVKCYMASLAARVDLAIVAASCSEGRETAGRALLLVMSPIPGERTAFEASETAAAVVVAP